MPRETWYCSGVSRSRHSASVRTSFFVSIGAVNPSLTAVDAVFARPQHPYTEALLAALPEHSQGARRLKALAGIVPGRLDRPAGCLLAPRCAYAQPRCGAERPPLADGVRCFFPLHQASRRVVA